MSRPDVVSGGEPEQDESLFAWTQIIFAGDYQVLSREPIYDETGLNPDGSVRQVKIGVRYMVNASRSPRLGKID